MIKNKAFVFRIFPNEDQKQFFAQTFGNIRYLYNKFIYDNYDELLLRQLSVPQQPSKFKKVEESSFLKKGDSLALANNYLNQKDALKRANSFETINAMKNKINKIVKNDKGFSAEIVTMKLQKASRYGLPKFKKKSGQQSYTTNNQVPNDKNTIIKDTIRLENSFIFLPKIKDGIKIIIHRDISKNMIIKSVTVRKSYSDFYEASILVEYQSNVNLLPLDSITNDKVEGLDFSVPNKFIDSLGQKANSQDYYKTMEKEIALLNQQLAKNKTISEKIFTDDKTNDYQGKNLNKLQNKI